MGISGSPSQARTGLAGWLFGQAGGGRILRFDPSTGTTAEYVTGYTPNASPHTIAPGPDGNMWFTEAARGIGRITTGWPAAMPAVPLTGSGFVGQPLVCNADVWGPNSTVTVGWQVDATAIPGHKDLAYTPSDADLGKPVTCTATGRWPWVLADYVVTSNAITITAPQGPPGPAGPDGRAGASGAAGAAGTAGAACPQGVPGAPGATAAFMAVFGGGTKQVKRGHTLKVAYAVTAAARLKFKLTGQSASRHTHAKAALGSNTLQWQLPKALGRGEYKLLIIRDGVTVTRTKVTIK